MGGSGGAGGVGRNGRGGGIRSSMACSVANGGGGRGGSGGIIVGREVGGGSKVMNWDSNSPLLIRSSSSLRFRGFILGPSFYPGIASL